MKITKNITLILFVIFYLYSSSQNTPLHNLNFENWEKKVLYEEPTGYFTFNKSWIKYDINNVIKTTDCHNGKFAIKLSSVSYNGNHINGYASYGIPSFLGDMNFINGFPYNKKPTAFNAYIKYNCQNNDSAVIFVALKKNENIIFYDEFYIYGIQNSFKKISFDINPDSIFEYPDSAVVGFKSSNDNSPFINIGNWIIVDNISFSNDSDFDIIPNGDFEEWDEVGYNEPEAWATFNKFCFAQNIPFYITEAEGYNNTGKAINIRTTKIFINEEPKIVSYITTGEFTDKLTIGGIAVGGFPIFANPDSISFFYKYDNSNNTKDSAIVQIFLKKLGLDFGTTGINLPATDVLKKISLKLNVGSPTFPPNTIADTANIILSSSNYYIPNKLNIGNELIIDDIQFIYNSTQPDKFKLSGIINYDNKDKTVLKDVKLVLKNKEGNEIATTMSDVEGKYMFDKLDKGEYIISASTGKTWRKVIPIDALFINRSFISVYKIESEFKKKAADVDGNKSVTPIDALFINRRFLGMVKTFKISDWLFDIPAVINLDKDMVLNIKALCAGDLRGDYKP